MEIKSAKAFRNWYKIKHFGIDKDDQIHNENFVGTYHKENGNIKYKGFFNMYHGDKPDIAGFLPSILKIAEDGQAIYEFLQNAVDCGSTHFYIFYNEKYFLAINNGSPFDIDGLQSILNIGQTTKDPDKIGRFGIGFKLAHRLVGRNEGTYELVNQYKGPILFSWSKFKDLESLLNKEKINSIIPNKENEEMYNNSPFLLKILLTNFPSEPNETVKDISYNDSILFPLSELDELIEFLYNNPIKLMESILNKGSLFFIKLGEDKKHLLDKDYNGLVNGIQYSMNTLNNLQKVYINNNDIDKITLELEKGEIEIGTEVFERISPEYKEFNIKFTIGFNTIEFGKKDSYEQIKFLKEKPNFYKYFPMGDEINGFGFIVHCDSFSNEANRRKLHDDDVNRNLFPVIAEHITQLLIKYKTNENERSKFLNLYATLLLSDIPNRQNNNWLQPIFYNTLLKFLKDNIPTKNGFSDNINNVKINKLKLNLNLANFGLSDIQWFEWDNEEDRILLDEALKVEKLGIKSWDITEVVENAKLESVNNWITSCDKITYEAFLKELEKSNLREEAKEKICQIKLFKFSDGNFYSINEIVITQFIQNRVTFNYRYSNVFFKTLKNKGISNELGKLGIILSEINILDYHNIFSSIKRMPDEKEMYLRISEKCKTNTLTAQEKKNLFLNFIDETTKFDNVSEDTLKNLCLFCDSKSKIKPLNKLIDCTLNTASWLNDYKIKNDEFFDNLKPYLVSDQEAIFKEIYIPNQDIILTELTEANEINSLIKLYQDNKRQFFKEFIIKKNEPSFSIARKTNYTYQVQSADQKARKFIEVNCSHNLFVLPQDFLDHKEEDGIVKADDLHSLILNFVNADELKENLVDIVKYKAKNQFLQKLSAFKFNPTLSYSKEDYEYKVLDLVCREFFEANNSNQQNDFRNFRRKLIIETGEKDFKYSEIPPISDKIYITSKEFSLSKILPSTYKNSNLISDLITQFSQLGIQRERLNALFGVNEEINIHDIFKKFSEQTLTLLNPDQFFFLIYYHKQNINIYVDLKMLLFDITCAVFPSDYALENEKIPEYLQNWIVQNEVENSNLENIGVYIENSTLVSLRKFFLSNSDFNLNSIAQDKNLTDGKMLLNTFTWLKEKKIELKSENEFAVFTEMVRVFNLNKYPNQALKIQNEFNFEDLNLNATLWKDIGSFSIYQYSNATLPKVVKLSAFQDYIFYRYNDIDNDYAVNGKYIYINNYEDKNEILKKVALDRNNNFTSEDSKDVELSELKEELKKYKKQGQTKENNPKPTFLDDVNDFITELEGTEWTEFVPELKKILELSVTKTKEKQKLFNLIAKIKLAKKFDIKFELANKDYNYLEIGDQKYFVHSARGAFAYIHPKEILKMNKECYKMALDFSTKSDIIIYDTAEDILNLNTNHILTYQHEKTLDELIRFCEVNLEANKHLLIIDVENSGEKSKKLLKLLNIEDDYQ